MIPSIGRIVHYTLTESDALCVMQDRGDVNRGNSVYAGDVFPMMITRVCVQGQVFLDGNDTLWVTSVQQGDGQRQWHEPPRV